MKRCILCLCCILLFAGSGSVASQDSGDTIYDRCRKTYIITCDLITPVQKVSEPVPASTDWILLWKDYRDTLGKTTTIQEALYSLESMAPDMFPVFWTSIGDHLDKSLWEVPLRGVVEQTIAHLELKLEDGILTDAEAVYAFGVALEALGNLCMESEPHVAMIFLTQGTSLRTLAFAMDWRVIQSP